MKQLEKLFFFVTTKQGETVPIEALVDPEKVDAFYQRIADDDGKTAVILSGDSKSVTCLDDFQTIIDKVFAESGANGWFMASMIDQTTRTATAVMIRKAAVNWLGLNPSSRDRSIISIRGFELELANSVESIKTQLRT